VISDAHLGLTAAIKRMFQGCCWQRCRVHFLRNLLSHVPIAAGLLRSSRPDRTWWRRP
jgi:transposase-like protein